MAELTYTLGEHPQIIELLSVLEQNNLQKQKEEVQALVGYIDGMEGKLAQMMAEMKEMRLEVGKLHDKGIRARCTQLVTAAEGKIQQARTMVSTAKVNLISSAGHIPAGAEFVGSALRELREELGVTAAPADLHECGLRRFRFEAEFHGKPFKDNQVSKVFCLWLDREAEDFAVQKSEIDYVKWFDLDEAVAAVEQGTIPNCIFPEELGMVKKFVGQTGGGC